VQAWTYTQICNGMLSAATPMITRIFEIRSGSNRLLLTASRLKVYGMLSFHVAWQP
jgi:hypothetical protein